MQSWLFFIEVTHYVLEIYWSSHWHSLSWHRSAFQLTKIKTLAFVIQLFRCFIIAFMGIGMNEICFLTKITRHPPHPYPHPTPPPPTPTQPPTPTPPPSHTYTYTPQNQPTPNPHLHPTAPPALLTTKQTVLINLSRKRGVGFRNCCFEINNFQVTLHGSDELKIISVCWHHIS